jgi:hypothetical protein
MSVDDCAPIQLPALGDARGKLCFVEGEHHVPFPIRRIFYIYDVPPGAERGAHALKACHQCLIAVSGSFDLLLDDGRRTRTIHLDQPTTGICVPPLIWRHMAGFAPGTVCLVLASEPYAEADYYRDYPAFLAAATTPTPAHPAPPLRPAP